MIPAETDGAIAVTSRIPPKIADRLRLPLIAAPMFRLSGPELVTAACKAGVIGGFATLTARSAAELDEWLDQIASDLPAGSAPCAANLIVRSPRVMEDLETLVRRRVEIVITSVGSPAELIPAMREVGTMVLSDVATLRHAERAVEAGADGLVLLGAGAGGRTGWMNPFAFVRAVRTFFDGPLVLAGGVSDGYALRAAEVLGCDLAYMGTAFLATAESRAELGYKQMIVESSLDDIIITNAFSGSPMSVLIPSIVASGLDPKALDESITPEQADYLFGREGEGPRRWSKLWSAGQSVSGVHAIQSVAELVETTGKEYADACTSDWNV